MIEAYLDWFLEFVVDGISNLSGMLIVPGVSLLHFMIVVSVLCIVVGGILIR